MIQLLCAFALLAFAQQQGLCIDVLQTCRALGEFATEAGMPQEKAGQLVNNFLLSLQTLDNTLISSLRSKTTVPDTADKDVEQAVQDLDRYVPAGYPILHLVWCVCFRTSAPIYNRELL